MILQGARLRIDLAPEFGARVTGLTDLVTGRQWLVQGPLVSGADYGPAQSRGWDECFPTILSCDTSPRDHGDLWGVAPRITTTDRSVSAIWTGPGWTFRRDLELRDDDTLVARYLVENTGTRQLDWIWSQHCLIAPREGDRVALSGLAGFTLSGQPANWPQIDGRDLSVLPPPDSGWMAKAYATATGPVQVELSDGTGGLRFAWSGLEIPACGLWFSLGGWQGQNQIAIEPCHAPAHDLDTARMNGTAQRLGPGESRDWSMTMQLTGAQPSDR